MKIAIFGRGPMSEMMSGYINESDDTVVTAYIESGDCLEGACHQGRPLIAISQVSDLLDLETRFYVAVGYSGLNSVRENFYLKLKDMGFTPYLYAHPSASISSAAKVGEHTWIFEKVGVQCGTVIGDNSILHMGVNVAHHSVVGANSFIAQGVNICGYVDVGRNCFIGAGAIIHNNLCIGDNCVVGAGAIVKCDMPANSYITCSNGYPKDGAIEFFNAWLTKIRNRI